MLIDHYEENRFLSVKILYNLKRSELYPINRISLESPWKMLSKNVKYFVKIYRYRHLLYIKVFSHRLLNHFLHLFCSLFDHMTTIFKNNRVQTIGCQTRVFLLTMIKLTLAPLLTIISILFVLLFNLLWCIPIVDF